MDTDGDEREADSALVRNLRSAFMVLLLAGLNFVEKLTVRF
jgi:hypothetical protein